MAIGRIVPMDFAADAVESRFAVLTGRLADIVKRVRAPRQPHLRSALEHLHRAARKQRLVRQSDLAVVAGRSPAQLSRDLKEATGFGFAQLIAAYRLQPAIPGIINGVERIAQQAFTGGYEDLRLFNRDFKRIFSMSPTEMRNCIRRQSELPMAGAVSSPFGRRSTGPAASPRVSIDAMKR